MQFSSHDSIVGGFLNIIQLRNVFRFRYNNTYIDKSLAMFMIYNTI